MPYELFDKKRTHGGPAAVSVTKYGNFVINSAAIELLQKRAYLQVYWNKDEGKVAFKPVKSSTEPQSYHVNYSPKGSVGSISGTAFLKHVGYTLKETKSFPASWNEKEGLLEIQLLTKGGTPKR
jgi:hypothetical protein